MPQNGLLIAACALAVSLVSAQRFTDTFDRQDGSPLAPPTYLSFPNLPQLTITDHRVCSAAHGAAIVAAPFSPTMTANLTWIPFDALGMEAYLLLAAGASSSAPLVLAGCDGGHGNGGFCTPTVALFNTTQRATGEPLAIKIGAAVRLEAAAAPTAGGSGLAVRLRVLEEGSGALLGSVSKVLQAAEPLTHAGFLVGRGGQPTCATSFAVTGAA